MIYFNSIKRNVEAINLTAFYADIIILREYRGLRATFTNTHEIAKINSFHNH